MKTDIFRSGAMMILASLLVFACGDSATDSNGDDTSDMPFGTQQDIAMADSMYSEYSGYTDSWDEYPGFTGWQEGTTPHGAWLRYYVNDIAKTDLDNFPYGSVIIKENYMTDNADSLAAVTFMTRIEGYDSDNYDWFYAKYLADGSLDENDAGMKLAGRVAKGAGEDGADAGCIGCHAGADGNDYVFAND